MSFIFNVDFLLFFRSFFFLLVFTIAYHASNAEILRLQKCAKFDAMFSVHERNKKLVGSVIAKFDGQEYFECIALCIKFVNCKSINHERKKSICELNSKEKGDAEVSLKKSHGWMQGETPKNPKQVGNS